MTRKALAADSRVELLEALSAAARPLDAAEAGQLVGLHRNTARVHLEQLTDAGLVERASEDRTQPGRPRVLYSRVTTAGGPTPPDSVEAQDDADYRELARVLAAQLASAPDPAAEAERAGRRWSAAVSGAGLPVGGVDAAQAVDAVTGIMERLGFSPVADDKRILLRRCPFAELAREQRAVVCGVHLGMLRQTFQALGAPVAVAGLDPLVQSDPLLCVVHLTDTPDPTVNTN
ncbi:helix-turn-helix domain-containing protein [Acidiferrimicrobium sp. IK]|uniref:helix-turn-helix transcriptional regulator n=1 Tax=Acidiferrimicrobium sp. IK TaxID=2871700 RepID=UPI0021CB20A0|nr:helix-turn-helix domain-containing protein [Acidiferrimicrobium sp. IK]MCU4185261.1 helix-turn-helix domain-containing protein [Acidiferrimicrobium sp. IK]